MARRHLPTGRSKDEGGHVRLYEWVLQTEAWRSLGCVERALYVEVSRRHRSGTRENNGRIGFSVREAAAALNIGRSTAARAFQELQAKGFLRIGKLSGFNVKGRVSTEWRLTEFPNALTGELATKEFAIWTPDEKTTVPSQTATVPPQVHPRPPRGTVSQNKAVNGAEVGL